MPKIIPSQTNQDHANASTPSNKPAALIDNSSTSIQALTTTSTSGASSHADSGGLRIFVVPSSVLETHESIEHPSYAASLLSSIYERETTLDEFKQFFAPQLDDNRINELRAELAAAKRAHLVAQTNFNARLAQVETRAIQAETRVSSQQIEIDSLRQEREQIAILTKQLDDENNEYLKLQTTMLDQQNMQQNFREQLAAAELTKQELQQKLVAAETSLASLISTATSTQHKPESERIEPMQRRILTLQTELDSTRNALTAEQTKVAQTASSLKIASEQKIRYEMHAAHYRRRLEEANKKLDAIKAELAQVKQQATAARTSISDYQQQLATTKTLLESHQAETIVINRTLTDLHESVRQNQVHHQTQLATITAQKFQLITERDHAHQRWQDELRQCQALEQELARIQYALQARVQQQQAQQYQPQYQQPAVQASRVPNPQFKRVRDDHDQTFAQDDRFKRSTTESSHQLNHRPGFFQGQPQSVSQQRPNQGQFSGTAVFRR